MPARFVGKTAIVTAGASGIGAATATRLAHEGAAVMIADISARRAAALATELRQQGYTAQWRKIDAAMPEDIAATVQETVAVYGRLDIMVNNAGYAVPQLLEELSLENWERTLAVTLTSVFLGIKYALPVLRQQGGGAIVNTASISGMQADRGLGAYNAAKAGVINLTRTAALENAAHHIRVNCVCPGGINTRAPQLLGGERETELRQAMAAAHPLGRMGEAAEIAQAIAFLASEEASFITGASLVVDGGITTHTGLPDMSIFARPQGGEFPK